jgi:PEP-CTERM motif
MGSLRRTGWAVLLGIAFVFGAAFLLSASGIAAAEPYTAPPGDLVAGNIVNTIDENGHGTLNGFLRPLPEPFALQNDPGPGGLPNVLTYSLLNPPRLTAGDVLLQDGVGGLISDVVRFNPNEVCVEGSTGCLVFYSDNIDGFDALGDTPAPSAFYANNITILEVGTEANNGAIYTPVAGQPGFVAGASAPVVYNLISDGTGDPIPEPTSLAILGIGLAGLGLARTRRSRTRQLRT